MKNKTATAFLLTAVISIWSWIAYKVHHTLTDQSHIENITTRIDPKQDLREEYYTLHIHNRDPFLSILTDTVIKPDTPVRKATQPIAEQKRLVLPEFCGLIKNKNNKIAILKFNKEFFFVGENEKFNDINIRSVQEDHIVVISNNESITILLKKL